MAKMFLMSGCSGSGKTTFSKRFAEEHNILYLGVDDFYKKVNGDECLHINSFDVWIEFFKAIHDAEIKCQNVIIDTNALTKIDRTQFIDWFPTFEHHLIYIECDDKLRFQNNLSRRRNVPEVDMKLMRVKLEVPYPSNEVGGWKSIVFIHNHANSFSKPQFMKGMESDWDIPDSFKEFSEKYMDLITQPKEDIYSRHLLDMDSLLEIKE